MAADGPLRPGDGALAGFTAQRRRRSLAREAGALEALFKILAGDVALGCELLAVLLLALGAAETAWGLASRPSQWRDLRFIKGIWLRFATRMLLALELTLAADIVRTAIAPSWGQIGQLAAIAAIRTGLNLFLERDIEKSEALQAAAAVEAAGSA